MSDWEWRTNGLYDGDVPILWVTQDNAGELYLGVFADYEDDIRNLPDLQDEIKKLREALEWAFIEVQAHGPSYREDCECPFCQQYRNCREILEEK